MTVTAPPTAPPERPPSGLGSGARAAVVVVSVLLLVLGWVLVGAGAVAIGVSSMGRDAAGYVMSDGTSWTSPGYAVQTHGVRVHGGPMGFAMPHRMLGTLRVTAEPTGDTGVFIGIARSDDVRRYLHDVARTTRSDPYDESDEGWFVDGGSPRVAPADAGFWVASAVGWGPQEVTWEPRPGSWRLVVMNAEGTTPVAAEVAVGADVPALRAAGPALVVGGVVLLAVAAAGGVIAMRRPAPAGEPT